MSLHFGRQVFLNGTLLAPGVDYRFGPNGVRTALGTVEFPFKIIGKDTRSNPDVVQVSFLGLRSIVAVKTTRARAF